MRFVTILNYLTSSFILFICELSSTMGIAIAFVGTAFAFSIVLTDSEDFIALITIICLGAALMDFYCLFKDSNENFSCQKISDIAFASTQ